MAPTPGALEIDIRFDDNWENCCTVKGPNAEANVLLIAAAPELLEACELIASAKGTVDVVRAVEKARAAITKALPEQGS